MTIDEHYIPTAFLCYARHDDVSDDGRIAKLRVLIQREVQATDGESFAILQDTSDFLVGMQFRDEIDAILEKASTLISFVTTSLFNSSNCRAEISRFRQCSESELVQPPIFPTRRFALARGVAV